MEGKKEMKNTKTQNVHGVHEAGSSTKQKKTSNRKLDDGYWNNKKIEITSKHQKCTGSSNKTRFL